MRIKRLEIKGFKSFPDRTVLDFKPGITSVVGPNGCGKSNVMEAIRWVMGEQRVRTLRSKKMEDVIFNGSEARKPVGMAEVRLVLFCEDGAAHPSMAEYQEIMITRRLFRDGDSQYELNNIPCRLSDITDFFLDTGVGKNSYAIIEQGRVDMVVASKPEDRRVLIEEAAGINRYKVRKEAALKKLEQTEENLRRINDVVGEVKRQSASLKRQASKAERYRKLSENLRRWDIGLNAHRCRVLQAESSRLGEELERNRGLVVERESLVATLTAALERDRLRALDTERDLKGLIESRYRAEMDLSSVRSGIEANRSRMGRIEEGLRRLRDENTALEKRMANAASRRDELEQARDSLRTDREAAATELKQALAETRDEEVQLEQQRKRLDQLKDAIFANLQQRAQERNRAEALARRANDVRNALEKHTTELTTVSAALAADSEEQDRVTQLVTETAQNRHNSTQRRNELVEARNLAREQIASLTQELRRGEKELAATSARRASLEEMQRDFRQYDEGVRFVMKHRDPAMNGNLLGPLAELIEAPPEYQKALTAFLGDRLGHVVVSSVHDGVEAAKALKESGAGRSTFIPLSPRPLSPAPQTASQETLTCLRDVIRFREGCENLGGFLLGRCFLVEDMRQAVEIWERNGVQIDLVTTAGEVLSRHGEITGGSENGTGEEIFEKRREMAILQDKIGSLEQTLADSQAVLHNEERRQETLSAEMEEAGRLGHELNLTEARYRKDIERLASQIKGWNRRLEVLTLERERLQQDQQRISTDAQGAQGSGAVLEAQRIELERERDEASRELERLTTMVRDNSRRTEGIRVRLAQLEERGRSLERELSAILGTIRHCERRIADVADEAARSEADKEQLGRDINCALEREQQLMKEHESLKFKTEALQGESAQLAESVKVLERQTAEATQALGQMRNQLHTLEMDAVKVGETLRGVVEKILERYDVDPRNAECPETLPDETEIAELKEKLEAIGEVNLAAIGESRQIEERLSFLLEQEEDLRKAVSSLYETVNTINKTTRERFKQAFDCIDEKFREIFPILFKGGEAHLVLTDEGNLLETGVDIMARPPGKRVQNMDLLSGGEKALTAVGLIFAIFLTRPSPFCLLDEVDAPLDEANLVRFNEMLRRLCDCTQFIVITHNKRSMEEADCLYGVTMEEPGASRVVSVQFMN